MRWEICNTEDWGPSYDSSGAETEHSTMFPFCSIQATHKCQRRHIPAPRFPERPWLFCSMAMFCKGSAPPNILFSLQNQLGSRHPLFNVSLSLKCSYFPPELSHPINSAPSLLSEQRKRMKRHGFGDRKTGQISAFTD